MSLAFSINDVLLFKVLSITSNLYIIKMHTAVQVSIYFNMVLIEEKPKKEMDTTKLR
jgi:hypothetical protein